VAPQVGVEVEGHAASFFACTRALTLAGRRLSLCAPPSVGQRGTGQAAAQANGRRGFFTLATSRCPWAAAGVPPR